LFSAAVSAQALPTEFPADAVPITAESLKQRVLGKKFVGKRADGRVLAMDFGADGSFRLSGVQSNGAPFMLDGSVRLEGDKLCQDMRKALESSCNEVRLTQNMLYYKRTVGEVVAYAAQ
jgi:hypothetical protein